MALFKGANKVDKDKANRFIGLPVYRHVLLTPLNYCNGYFENDRNSFNYFYKRTRILLHDCFCALLRCAVSNFLRSGSTASWQSAVGCSVRRLAANKANRLAPTPGSRGAFHPYSFLLLSPNSTGACDGISTPPALLMWRTSAQLVAKTALLLRILKYHNSGRAIMQ